MRITRGCMIPPSFSNCFSGSSSNISNVLSHDHSLKACGESRLFGVNKNQMDQALLYRYKPPPTTTLIYHLGISNAISTHGNVWVTELWKAGGKLVRQALEHPLRVAAIRVTMLAEVIGSNGAILAHRRCNAWLCWRQHSNTKTSAAILSWVKLRLLYYSTIQTTHIDYVCKAYVVCHKW